MGIIRQLRRPWLFCLVCIFLSPAFAESPLCYSECTHAYVPCGTPNLETWPNGLPKYVYPNELFAQDPDTGMFHRVGTNERSASRIYLRFVSERNQWLWVTGEDLRPIAADSKVQQWRLGVPSSSSDRRGLNWYRLDKDWYHWKKTTDRVRPEVWRLDECGNLTRTELASEDWPKLGGEVDPLPTDKPSCLLSLPAGAIKSNQPFKIVAAIKGGASELTLEGQKVAIQKMEGMEWSAEVTLTAGSPGFFTAVGKVRGPGGENQCEISYSVEPDITPMGDGKLSCVLTLDRASAKPEDFVLATLSAKGEPVIRAELDGQLLTGLAVPSQNLSIRQRVRATSGVQKGVDYRMVKALVTGNTRSAECSAPLKISLRSSFIPDKP